MLEGGKAKMAERSYTRDTGKFWNQAPIGITEAPTKETAKQLIKSYCKTLPL